MAGDEVDDFEIPLFEKDEAPIKAQSQLKRALYNQSRLRKGGRSRRETSMPKFAGDEGMLSYKTIFKKDDPTASKELRSMAKLSESSKREVFRTALPPDVASALRSMTLKFGANIENKKILIENDNNLEGIDEIVDDEE